MNYRHRNHHRHSTWRQTTGILAGVSLAGLFVLTVIDLVSEAGWIKQAPVNEVQQPDPNFEKDHLTPGNLEINPNIHLYRTLPADVTVQGDTLEVMPNAGPKSSIVALQFKPTGRPSRHMLSSNHSFFGTQDIRGTEAYKTAQENSETLDPK